MATASRKLTKEAFDKTKNIPTKAVLIPTKSRSDMSAYFVAGYGEDYGGSKIKIRYNGKEIFSSSFEAVKSEISCGVTEVYNLPTNTCFTALIKHTGDAQLARKLFMDGFIMMLENIKVDDEGNDTACAFIIMSNIVGKQYDFMNSILSEICAESNIRKNPNTGNDIKIWIY